jgi:hypothetical protein
MARTTKITAMAIPALKPGFWVTEMGAWVDVAEAIEAVELLVWDIWEEVDEWLDVGTEVDEADALFDELEVLVVLLEVEDGVLDVVCETEDDFDDVGEFVLVLAGP